MPATPPVTVLAVVMVSFISCCLSLQAAASRLLYAYARDHMIVGSELFSRISPHSKVPVVALLFAGLVPALIALCGLWLQDAIATIISFASIGIYLAFQMVVLAALIARIKGWVPSGPFTLKGFGLPVNVMGLAYGLFAIIDMMWPRSPEAPWFSNYAMIVTSVGIVLLGLLYMVAGRPYERGGARVGDA